MVKILGLDLDGTLLNDEKDICRKNIEILQKALEQGVKIVLCSGRSPDGMQRELIKLGIKEKGQYGIGLNGGVIFETDTNRIVKKSSMKKEAVLEVIRIGRELSDEANIQLYTGENVYVERWNETTSFYEKATGSHPVVVPDLTEYADRAVKLVFFCHGEIDPSLKKVNALKRKVQPQMPKGNQCVISAPYLLEMFDEKTDKGQGMRELAAYLNVPMEETLCVGDQENDLPMLRAAGMSAVMANGAEEVKAIGDYVTKLDNNEGGVAEVVEKFILQ